MIEYSYHENEVPADASIGMIGSASFLLLLIMVICWRISEHGDNSNIFIFITSDDYTKQKQQQQQNLYHI